MDEPQRKRLTRKKAEPPAPRQPRVRPRLAVTVLGDPDVELLTLGGPDAAATAGDERSDATPPTDPVDVWATLDLAATLGIEPRSEEPRAAEEPVTAAAAPATGARPAPMPANGSEARAHAAATPGARSRRAEPSGGPARSERRGPATSQSREPESTAPLEAIPWPAEVSAGAWTPEPAPTAAGVETPPPVEAVAQPVVNEQAEPANTTDAAASEAPAVDEPTAEVATAKPAASPWPEMPIGESAMPEIHAPEAPVATKPSPDRATADPTPSLESAAPQTSAPEAVASDAETPGAPAAESRVEAAASRSVEPPAGITDAAAATGEEVVTEASLIEEVAAAPSPAPATQAQTPAPAAPASPPKAPRARTPRSKEAAPSQTPETQLEVVPAPGPTSPSPEVVAPAPGAPERVRRAARAASPYPAAPRTRTAPPATPVEAPAPAAESVTAPEPIAPEAPVARRRRIRPAAAAPTPATLPEAPAPRYIVDAPGWPRPGELNDGAKGGDTSSTSSDRSETASAPAADEGWRPYRAVYRPTTLPTSEPVDNTPKWKGSNPFDPQPDPPAEPRQIRQRPRGTNPDPKSSRAEEIAEKVRRALGADELPPHFDKLVASMLSAYADDSTAETGEPTGR